MSIFQDAVLSLTGVAKMAKTTLGLDGTSYKKRIAPNAIAGVGLGITFGKKQRVTSTCRTDPAARETRELTEFLSFQLGLQDDEMSQRTMAMLRTNRQKTPEIVESYESMILSMAVLQNLRKNSGKP